MPSQALLVWVGHLFALAVGFAQACLFICARKAGHTSVLFMSGSAQLQAGPAVLILSYTPVIDDFSLAPMIEAPWQGLGWILLCAFCFLSGGMLMTMGAKRCPAAVSAVVATSSSMIVGFVSQIFLFGVVPKALTLVGASLMMLGVLTMVASQGRGEQEELVEDVAETGHVELQASAGDDDETESLSSFVASEFSGVSLSKPALRQRHGSSNTLPPAQAVGFASLVPES